MRIYISGPMTGIEDFNKPAFMEAEKKLKAAGYEVANPARVELEPDAAYEDFMKKDIAMLVDCDGMALLDDWEKSPGSNFENLVCEWTGIWVGTLNAWLKGSVQNAGPSIPATRPAD